MVLLSIREMDGSTDLLLFSGKKQFLSWQGRKVGGKRMSTEEEGIMLRADRMFHVSVKIYRSMISAAVFSA